MKEDAGHDEALTTQVAFDYIKSNLFRVSHADGMIGGITPGGNLHIAFYSERGPIPQREVRAIQRDGTLGDVIADKSVVRPAIIREMDIDIVMSLQVAETVLVWLQTTVEQLKMIQGGKRP